MSSWAQVSASGSHSRQLRRIHHTAYSPRSMKASFKIPNGSQAGDSTATKTIRETTGASISGRSGLKKRLSTGSHRAGCRVPHPCAFCKGGDFTDPLQGSVRMLYRREESPTLSHKTRKDGAPSGFELD